MIKTQKVTTNNWQKITEEQVIKTQKLTDGKNSESDDKNSETYDKNSETDKT